MEPRRGTAGRCACARGNYSAALQTLSECRSNRRAPGCRSRFLRARRSGKVAGTERSLGQLACGDPADNSVRAVLAQYYDQQGDAAAAIGQYEPMAKSTAHPVVLNNLAWLLPRHRRCPGGGIDHAEEHRIPAGQCCHHRHLWMDYWCKRRKGYRGARTSGKGCKSKSNCRPRSQLPLCCSVQDKADRKLGQLAELRALLDGPSTFIRGRRRKTAADIAMKLFDSVFVLLLLVGSVGHAKQPDAPPISWWTPTQSSGPAIPCRCRVA